MLDQCEDCPHWQQKIEEEVGPQIRILMNTIDESSRDALVESSDVFKRFVRKLIYSTLAYRILRSRSSLNEWVR